MNKELINPSQLSIQDVREMLKKPEQFKIDWEFAASTIGDYIRDDYKKEREERELGQSGNLKRLVEYLFKTMLNNPENRGVELNKKIQTHSIYVLSNAPSIAYFLGFSERTAQTLIRKLKQADIITGTGQSRRNALNYDVTPYYLNYKFIQFIQHKPNTQQEKKAA